MAGFDSGGKASLGSALVALWLCLIFWSGDAHAAPAFSILAVETTLEDGVYLLDISEDLELGTRLADALESGVPLVFKTEIEIYKPHRWFPNETVGSLAQRYELTYRSLSRRYVVRNLNTDDQLTFATLREALNQLETIKKLPVIDANLVTPGAHKGKIRVLLDASYLPLPLRVRALTSRVWGASSPWVGWSFQ
ncbi:MAG: DUF4390 domain-containing protein [bacterium]